MDIDVIKREKLIFKNYLEKYHFFTDAAFDNFVSKLNIKANNITNYGIDKFNDLLLKLAEEFFNQELTEDYFETITTHPKKVLTPVLSNYALYRQHQPKIILKLYHNYFTPEILNQLQQLGWGLYVTKDNSFVVGEIGNLGRMCTATPYYTLTTKHHETKVESHAVSTFIPAHMQVLVSIVKILNSLK